MSLLTAFQLQALICTGDSSSNPERAPCNRDADKSLAQPKRKQANASVRMAWISFGALICRGGGTWWQLASRCCWNRARPWHASELVSFLVGLRTYQQTRRWILLVVNDFINKPVRGANAVMALRNFRLGETSNLSSWQKCWTGCFCVKHDTILL